MRVVYVLLLSFLFYVYAQTDSLLLDVNTNKVKLSEILNSGGKLTLGKLDYDLIKVFNYNDYEGGRLGLGAKTNYKFSENYSLNGYVAYGLKDKQIKYGIGTNIYVNKPYNGKVFLSYSNDVAAAGRTSPILQSNHVKSLLSNFNNLYNNIFYSNKRVNIGYEQDALNNLTFNISGNYTEQQAKFLYNYKSNSTNKNYLFFDTTLALLYTPNDRNVKTPYGKVNIEHNLPIFYLALTKNWNILNADYTFTKIDFSYYDDYRTFLGKSNVVLKAGINIGSTPIFNLFEGMGNAKERDFIMGSFRISGRESFETMLPSEFFSDKYTSFQIKHVFGGIKLLNKEIYPEFIYRSLIGGLNNIEDHQKFSFMVPQKYYQEAGVELNQLFLKMVGLGVYYRFGAYSLGGFSDNFFIKATVRLTTF